MQLKKALLVGMAILSMVMLGACSTSRTGGANGMDQNAAMTEAGGAQAMGTGDNANFNDDNGKSTHSASTRVYYFDFDKSDVHEGDKPSIYAHANYLISHPHATVIVEGHTDPRGSREYNVALAERRANAVADLLESHGVNRHQIRVVSYGAERLAVPGHTEEDYQLDRRAVIVYMQ